MTAVNHALTGSIVVATINNPQLGLPLALLSHFILDALPHFGAHTIASPKSKEFRAILLCDGLLTMCFIMVIAFVGYRIGLDWWLLPFGAILAVLPDFMWYKHYKSDLQGKTKTWDPVRKAHKKIQQWEVSWGWIIEVLWYIAAILILYSILFTI